MNQTLIHLDEPFIDERGTIQNLITTGGIESVAVITSKKDSVRSNHYHINGSGHYLYIVNGKVKYYERDLDGTNIKINIYNAGQMIFTPERKVHKVEFLEDSLLVSMAPRSNSPDNHDADTIPMEF